MKGGCPVPTVSYRPAMLGRSFTECDTWRDAVLRRLAAEPAPALVVLASLNHYDLPASRVTDGWLTTLRRLAAVRAPVVYLADNPYPDGDVPACVSGALADWSRCAFPRSKALPADPLLRLVAAGRAPKLRVVDLNPLLCPGSGATCPAVLGSTLLYRDGSHLTNTATLRLVPAVEASLHRQGLLR
jgi:SGNH domain (fused to AT3 domains)